jgi:hypothetical protein
MAMFNREVDSGNGRYGKTFIDFSIKFYRDCKGWILSLTNDARQMLDHRHHSFYKNGDMVFFYGLYRKTRIRRTLSGVG